MKRIIKVALFLFGGILLSVWAWTSYVITKRASARYTVTPIDLSSFVANSALGERIARVRSGCVDCHGQDFGGNVIINDGAMGSINGPNISPTKLASWSDSQIAAAIHNCVRPDGSPLFFMPCADFVNLSGDDLASLIVFLRTVPPVDRADMPHKLGPLARILVAARQIPNAYTAEDIDHQKPLNQKPPEAPTREFGEYLAQSCVGCHGPTFKGGPIKGAPPDWAPAADLTQTSLASWTFSDFQKAMREGLRPDGKTLQPPFPLPLLSQMNELEVTAMWEFFKTLP